MAAMDVDMDLDLTVDAPVEEQFNDAPFEDTTIQPEPTTTASATQINPFDSSVVGAGDIAFEKIHIRGLDHLDNSQLKSYRDTYYPSDRFQKVEWVDDTSANFVYDSATAAAEALVAFSNTDMVDVSQLDSLVMRPAKTLQVTRSSGEVENHDLQIRMATSSDVKKKGAHDSSRFYLMHPDKDPREQRFKERRDRIHRNVENGDYRRMNFDDRERKRRREQETFDESMYDDDAGIKSADDDDRRKKVRFGSRREPRDLFAGRNNGRLRDRSASPMRGDGDGRYGFGNDPDMAERSQRRIRQRSLTPPRRNNGNSNAGKELFASRSLAPAPNLELFPNKTNSSGPLNGGTANHSASSSMELFPDKVRKSHHRRSGAIDASPERFLANGHDRPRSLADRITGGPRPNSAGGSLASRITRDDDGDAGISIRGNSGGGLNIRGNSGLSIKGRSEAADDFSIKGASSGSNSGAVKELFPAKTVSGGANSGKELFGEKLKGRGAARRTAASYYS